MTITTDSKSTITDAFYVILVKDLEGGYSIPRARYIITRAPKSDKFVVATKVRPEGERGLTPALNRMLKVEDHIKEIARFQEIMNEIPTQYCGVEDLYGRETSIVHMTDPNRLDEIHRSGSEAPKVPRPTEEQKVKFNEALAIIDNWIRREGPLPMY